MTPLKILQLTHSYEKALDDYLAYIKKLILIRANKLTEQTFDTFELTSDINEYQNTTSTSGLHFNHFTEAINDYALGKFVDQSLENSNSWERFF